MTKANKGVSEKTLSGRFYCSPGQSTGERVPNLRWPKSASTNPKLATGTLLRDRVPAGVFCSHPRPRRLGMIHAPRRLRRRGETWIRVALSGLLLILAARADVIVSNLNLTTGNGGYDICGTAVTGGNCSPVQSLAQQFTPDGNFLMTQATVVVGNQDGTSPLFDVWVAHDSSGSPGSLIEQIGFDVGDSDDVDQSFRSDADQFGAKRRRALSV